PPTFALIHDLTFAETRKDLPVPIRQKIVGERTVIDGKVAPDGESIDVDFVEKDPKWDYYPDTGKYVILEMRDAHKSYRLTRPAEIHISHIYVDYTEAEEHNRQLRREVADIDGNIQALQPILDDAKQKYQVAVDMLRQSRSVVDALK